MYNNDVFNFCKDDGGTQGECVNSYVDDNVVWMFITTTYTFQLIISLAAAEASMLIIQQNFTSGMMTS